MLSEPSTAVPFGCFLEVLLGDERVSVLVCERARDVHGVQQDEDVGLQELDQQLEEADRDEEQPRQERIRFALKTNQRKPRMVRKLPLARFETLY